MVVMHDHAAATAHDECIGRTAGMAVDEPGYSVGADSAASHRHTHHRRFLSEADARRPDPIRLLMALANVVAFNRSDRLGLS